MQVLVRLFALARQQVGRNELTVQVDEPATVGHLKAAIADQNPELIPLLPHLLFAVATNYATDETLIPPGAEVAAIPPVSGGGPTGTEQRA